MIFIADLFAPTVPSDPRPQNLHLFVPFEVILTFSSTGSDSPVTSSTIDIVKLSFGFSDMIFLNTVRRCVGVVSFEPSPSLPPTITGAFSLP